MSQFFFQKDLIDSQICEILEIVFIKTCDEHLFLFLAWLEASYQDKLDPGNTQHENLKTWW